MPHNLLITKQGAMETVSLKAEAMLKDPEAFNKSFIPDTPEVLFSTKLINHERDGAAAHHGADGDGRLSVRLHVPWTLAHDERDDERGARAGADVSGLMRTPPFAFAAVLGAVLLAVTTVAQQAGPRWTLQESGVTARLRGISAVNDNIVWASGNHGTIVRTIDGGKTWQTVTPPPETQKLDFRDIDAFDAEIGLRAQHRPGQRLADLQDERTAGQTWTPQFVNRDEKAFFDAMVFWGETRGVAVSDSVDGRFVLLMTENGGDTWTPVPAAALPPALPNEGAFAASGTNVTVPFPIGGHGNTPRRR